MKLLTRTLSSLTIASLALFFANCGGDDGNSTPTEKTQLGKLVGTWVIESVTLDNVDKLDDYTGFTLDLDGTYDKDNELPFPYAYTTTNRPDLSPWDAAGDWGFGSNAKTQIVREDGLGITYTLASDGSLTLEYTFFGDGFPGARTAEVEGDWIMVLTK